MEWTEIAKEWIALITRWVHIFAGILWIGQTWYFTWLDLQFEDAEANPGNKVWMVHSGGFYSVDKIKVPSPMPKTLHWFRWEAMFTALSGLVLLYFVYLAGGLMTDLEGNEFGLWPALGITLGTIGVPWLIYDFLWKSPLAKNPALGATICYVLLVVLAWGLSQRITGRAAFILVAAALGTIMVNNVWNTIIPNQRRMIADRIAGREPDEAMAIAAKNRSKHNTFIIMPVLFLMISNHFPTATYGHEMNWLVFAVVTLLSWAVVPVVRKR